MVDPSPPLNSDAKAVPMTAIDPEQFALGKTRIKQIFDYLKALNDLRNPAERQIAKQEWRLWLDELPDHTAIRRGTPQSHKEDSDTDEERDISAEAYILKVRRPEVTNAPSPPEGLLPYRKNIQPMLKTNDSKWLHC
ncbi:MAG: hypothetical protein CMJ46_16830 [Planctomyces sp.]|nr:hypothetical protein [Planctomyces sp.]